MVLYKGFLSTNYRNAFILNSFFAAFVAVVAINSSTFFNKLFENIAKKTTKIVTKIEKNIKDTVELPKNTPVRQDQVSGTPGYRLPHYVTPYPNHYTVTSPPHHYRYHHSTQSPTHHSTQSPTHHSTQPEIYDSFTNQKNNTNAHHNNKHKSWFKKHLPFLFDIKYQTIISTVATFLFTYLSAFLVYVVMYVTIGFGGGMITGCDKYSCTWAGKGRIGEVYTV